MCGFPILSAIHDIFLINMSLTAMLPHDKTTLSTARISGLDKAGNRGGANIPGFPFRRGFPEG
jgi:hypothetical protein